MKKRNKLDYFDVRDANHPTNILYDGIENFDGLVHYNERSCTDKLCCLVFVLLNILLITFMIFASLNYDFNRLYRGYDFRGDICGKFPLEDRKFLYF